MEQQAVGATIGVEEEYFVVDATTGALRPRAERIHAAAAQRLGDRVQLELQLSQIEVGTPICRTLEQVATELLDLRGEVMAAAAEHDSRIVATGTHPFSHWLGQQITPKPRYSYLDEHFGLLATQQLVSGCHVHVSVPDPALTVPLMDRVRAWLPTVRALAVNSPYWLGVDTGYASHRMSVFDRWPTAGPPPLLGTRAAYDELVEALVETDTIDDASRVYWDVRPSMRLPTLEYRVADVCGRVGEAVMVAGLVRSLTRVAHRDLQQGAAHPRPPTELLRAARWRAARDGLTGLLVTVDGRRLRPAAQVVEDLLAHLHDDLVAHDEWDLVASAVRRSLREGTGAERQRAAFARRSDLHDVVAAVVRETAELPAIDLRARPTAPGDPSARGPDLALAVQHHLVVVDYPADREDLVAAARASGAPPDVVEALRGLALAEYCDLDDVLRALG